MGDRDGLSGASQLGRLTQSMSPMLSERPFVINKMERKQGIYQTSASGHTYACAPAQLHEPTHT